MALDNQERSEKIILGGRGCSVCSYGRRRRRSVEDLALEDQEGSESGGRVYQVKTYGGNPSREAKRYRRTYQGGEKYNQEKYTPYAAKKQYPSERANARPAQYRVAPSRSY